MTPRLRSPNWCEFVILTADLEVAAAGKGNLVNTETWEVRSRSPRPCLDANDCVAFNKGCPLAGLSLLFEESNAE